MLVLFHSSGRTGIPKINGFHQFFALKLGGILFLLCRKINLNFKKEKMAFLLHIDCEV
jgi:hypothetical protein